MANRMQTSRRALDRFARSTTNTSVTLHTLQRAAVAIGSVNSGWNFSETALGGA